MTFSKIDKYRELSLLLFGSGSEFDRASVCKKFIKLKRWMDTAMRDPERVCGKICDTWTSESEQRIYRCTIMDNPYFLERVIIHASKASDGIYYLYYSFLFPEIYLVEAEYIAETKVIICKYLVPHIQMLNKQFWSKKMRELNILAGTEVAAFKKCMLHILLSCSQDCDLVESWESFRDFIFRVRDRRQDVRVYDLSFCGYCQEDKQLGIVCNSGSHILYCLQCELLYKMQYKITRCLYCFQ